MKVSLSRAIVVGLAVVARSASAYTCSRAHLGGRPASSLPILAQRAAPARMAAMKTITHSDEYLAIVEGDEAESIAVIKFVAPWCRLCKAVSLKLAATANKFPEATFYEVPMVKDTEPFRYFARNEPEMKLPYVEVWAGRKGCLLYTSPSPRDS